MVMVLAPHRETSDEKWEQLKVPKQKTNSAAKKRFKITGNGRLKRRHAMQSHNLEKKSAKRHRAFRADHLRGRERRPRGQAPARAVEVGGGRNAPRQAIRSRAQEAPQGPLSVPRATSARARPRTGRPRRPSRRPTTTPTGIARRRSASSDASGSCASTRAPGTGPLLQPVRRRLPQGRDRAGPQGARRHRGPRPGRVLEDRRAGQGGPRGLI